MAHRFIYGKMALSIAKTIHYLKFKKEAFCSGEVGFGRILPPTVSPCFQKAKMGEIIGIPLPQIPFFGILGRQEGVLHWF